MTGFGGYGAEPSDVLDRAGRALRSDMEAARADVGDGERPAPAIHLVGRGRGELRDLLLRSRAFVQQPELQPVPLDRDDPLSVEPAPTDRVAYGIERGSASD